MLIQTLRENMTLTTGALSVCKNEVNKTQITNEDM